MQDTEFDETFDEYTAEEIGSLTEVEGIFTITRPEDISEGDFNLDVEPYEEVKVPDTPDKKEEIPNQELRLINAYFKEVGTEPLLIPREELKVAAKIKKM
jgi:hypothetical protein